MGLGLVGQPGLGKLQQVDALEESQAGWVHGSAAWLELRPPVAVDAAVDGQSVLQPAGKALIQLLACTRRALFCRSLLDAVVMPAINLLFDLADGQSLQGRRELRQLQGQLEVPLLPCLFNVVAAVLGGWLPAQPWMTAELWLGVAAQLGHQYMRTSDDGAHCAAPLLLTDRVGTQLL